MDLSVVIVSYNVKGFLEQALRTILEACEELETEVIVVDNASSDGSAEMVRALFPSVQLIPNENVGFARANNLAIRRCRGRHVLLINPDTIVPHRDALRKMVGFMDTHSDVGAAGCKILNPDGTLQLACRRSFPSPGVAFFKIIGLSNLFPNSPRFGAYNLTYLNPDEVHEVDAISGSFMVVRRETIDRVGLLDERWFMYGEDLDWCYRIKQAGWKILYVPTVEIIHFKGESAKSVSKVRDLIMFYRAMYTFVKKHFSRRFLFLRLEWLLTVGIVLRGLFSLGVKILQTFSLPLLDSALVLAGLWLGITIRFHYGTVHPPPYTRQEWVLIYGVCWLIWLGSLYAVGVYRSKRYSSVRALAGISIGFAWVILLVFFFKQYNFSRLAALYAWGFNAIFVAGWRGIVHFISRTFAGREIGRRRALIVGTEQEGRSFLRTLNRYPHLEYEILGFVDIRSEMRGVQIGDKRVIGIVEDLPRLVRDYRIDEVVVTTRTVSYSRILGLSGGLWGPMVQFKLVPSSFESLVNGRKIERVEDLPVIDIESRPRGMVRRILRGNP